MTGLSAIHNFSAFSNANVRQAAGTAPPKITSNTKSSASVPSAEDIKDEYIPSTPASSTATYFQSTASRAWERMKAYTNAFEKTTLEGKSLAEWMFCIQQYPHDPQDGYNFLYIEGDSAFGGGKYISFEQTSVLTDVVKIEGLEDITPEDLELLVQEGLENQERKRKEETEIESDEPNEPNELNEQNEPDADDIVEEHKEELAADVSPPVKTESLA